MTGSLARYGLSLAAQRLSVDWPAGTLASNILGCFIIGLLAEAATHGETVSPEARLLLATGFCGGFTTLSSLMHESAHMLRAGDPLYATLYLAGTLAVSGGAFLGGLLLVRLLQPSAGA
jgi:CrcB protein